MSEFNPKPETDVELPEELRRALIDLHQPPVEIPRHIDQAILARARAEHAPRRRMWVGTRWAAIGLTAAAMATVAIRLFAPIQANNHSQLAQAGDVNHDSKVNILDAYIVARHIARHESLDAAWDINGDGVVDQKDVDLIAAMAVAAPAEVEKTR